MGQDVSKLSDEPVVVGVLSGIGVFLIILLSVCVIACCVHRRNKAKKQKTSTRKETVHLPPIALTTDTTQITSHDMDSLGLPRSSFTIPPKGAKTRYRVRTPPTSEESSSYSDAGAATPGKRSPKRIWSVPEPLSAHSRPTRTIRGYSLLDSPAPTSVLDRPELDPPPKRSARGSLQFSIRFMPNSSLLIVTVIRATGILSSFQSPSNPYVKVYLSPEWAYAKRKTVVVWDDRHPNFNDTFTFERKPEEVGDSTLIFRVLNADILSRYTVLGEVEIPLKNVPLTEPFTAWRNLESRMTEANIELETVLTFCSASHTFRMTILSVCGLESELTDGYCKGYMYLFKERTPEKKSTTDRVGPTMTPHFEKPLVFHVKTLPLERISIVVVLKDASRSPHERIIGRLVLGSLALAKQAKQHFLDALADPGKAIRQTHSLVIE
eukprot:m.219573 g.219573  ORF g.219573 m.219573 type:complete len:437 (+) comp39924_c0_seq46:68-1378(+)